jgi:predicted acylesterase/phospholipase RssA
VLEHRLRAISLFRDLPDESLKSIAARLKRKRYRQGAVVFREGDIGGDMYLVESGQLQVVVGSADNQQPLAYLGPGSFVGEIALLLEQPRSATLKVIIDAELWVLHKRDLEDLLAEHPSIGLHLSREIGQRLVTTSHQAPPLKARLTAVWGDGAYELALALADHSEGLVGLLPLPGSPELPGTPSPPEGIAFTDRVRLMAGQGLTEQSLAEDLSHQLKEFDHVLLILPENFSRVGQKALALSDYAVSFDPPPEWIQENVPSRRRLDCGRSSEAIQRIARRLSNRTVGLALSSGGSRTIAHIGVVRVLRQAGIPIDIIAGSSGGALFGALIAAGWSDQKLVELARKLGSFNTFPNWDLNLPPWYGLIKGRRARDLIDGWLEGRHFSDLEIPLYVVATDIGTGQEVIFDSGPVADAVRASIGIPIVAAPWRNGDTFLIDGAVVNPLPASVLRRPPNGSVPADIVIGSSVVHTPDDPHQPKFEKTPHLLQVISRMISSMEKELIKTQLSRVDVTIHPHVFVDHALDFGHADTLIALGEEAARAQLAECQRVLAAGRVPAQRAEQPVF